MFCSASSIYWLCCNSTEPTRESVAILYYPCIKPLALRLPILCYWGLAYTCGMQKLACVR